MIDVDFTKGDEIYDRITRELAGLEIGVLVNNVGMSYKYPEYLHEVGLYRQNILSGTLGEGLRSSTFSLGLDVIQNALSLGQLSFKCFDVFEVLSCHSSLSKTLVKVGWAIKASFGVPPFF